MKTVIAMMLTMFAVTAVAQGQAHLEVRTVVQKQQVVQNEAGEAETKLVAAETVTPGESVFYTITFKNMSDEAADNVVITNPIASELTYVDGSAFGAGMEILFSVDGGQKFAIASTLTVSVDGEDVPIPHFGVVLELTDWHALAARLSAAEVAFVIEPYVRFEGSPGEQATMFFQDPSGNNLEFKAFKDISKQLFET